MILSEAMRRLTILLLLLYCSSSFSQELSDKPFSSLTNDSLFFLTKSISSPDSLSIIYYTIGRKLINNDGEKSISYLDTSISLAHEAKNDWLEYKYRLKLVTPLINTTKYDKARLELERSEPFYKNYQNGELYVEWLIVNGFLETEIGNTEQALKYLTEGMQIALASNQMKNLHDIYNRIGILYNISGNTNKSLEYYNKIIESCDKNNIKYYRTAAYNNGAYIYQELKDTVKAIKYFSEVLSLRKSGSSKRNLGFAYTNMTQVAIMKNQYDQALLYADSALQLFQAINLKPMVLGQYFSLSDTHELNGDNINRIKYIKKAFQYATEWDLTLVNPHIIEKYAEVLSEEGNYKQAYALLKQSESLKDSLQSVASKKEFESLEEKLALEKEKIVTDKMDVERDLQQSKMKQQKLKSFFLTIISLLLLGFITLLYFRSEDRKKTNRALSKKNEIIENSLKEKETLLKEIHHRVKNNLQIVSSLLNLQTRHIKDQNVLDAVTESRNRVKSMALIHQKLYQQDNFKGVVISDYIETLISSLIHSYKVKNSIQIITSLDPICLEVDSAIPLGLITNELITNSLKYAFIDVPGGNIWVNLHEENSILTLEIKDEGIGISDEKLLLNSESFGYVLIHSLAHKLKADIKINTDSGLGVRLDIKNYTKVKK